MQRNFSRAALLLLWLFLIVNRNVAQHRTIRIYTAEDGLVSNSINRMLQDEDGFIWFGSNEGLSIYDGNHFTNFTVENKGLSQNSISFIFAKSRNEVWIPHRKGIDVFVKRKFVKTIPVTGVKTILRDKSGRLLVAGDDGISEIIGEQKHLLFPSGKSFFDFYEYGNYYIADESSWESTTLFDHSFKPLTIYTKDGIVLKDVSGVFWFFNGRESWLIDTIALRKGTIEIKPVPALLRPFVNEGITYPFTDTDSSYWVSLYSKGVLYVNKDGNIKKYDITTGLNSNLTIGFFEDAEKNIWVTGNNGVIKFFNREIDILTQSTGLASQFVSSIAISELRQCVWMAQINGISCLYKNKIYNFPYPDNERCTWTTIAIQGDSLWVGSTSLRLYKINYKTRPQLELIKRWGSPKSIDDIQVYKGGILISNAEELYYVNKNGHLLKLADSRFFFRFLVDGDELWGGARDGEGIAHWKIIPNPEKPSLQQIQQFPSTKGYSVHGIGKDLKGNFWFGLLNSGVIELKPQENDSFIIRHYQTQNGLGSNKVEDIFISSSGKIYAGTNLGLSVFQTAGDTSYFEDVGRKFGFATEVYSITESYSGDLWLATPSGAIKIKGDSKQRTSAPRIFITQVLNNSRSDSLHDLRSIPLSVSYDENNFSFEFSSTSYRNEDQVLYSYQLIKNNDSSKWSLPAKIHNVSLAGLSAGKYTFFVKALSTDNVWSEIPAHYQFIIVPPYWEKWWFRSLLVVILFGVIAGIFWFRLRHIKNISAIRTKISRDLHDEIGSTLSGVSLFSEMAKQQLSDKKDNEADKSLDRIITSSDEMLGKMSDIVWAINPQNDSFDKIITRLRIFASGITSQKRIALHFKAGHEMKHFNPGMEHRNNIYMICKEAINNAVKYSACENLYVDLQQEDHHIDIVIRDDGKGFNIQENQPGNGLKNMQERAEEIRAGLTINSFAQKGTEIRLVIKITRL